MTVLRNCMPPTELGVSFRALPQSYAKDLAPRADGCGSARAAEAFFSSPRIRRIIATPREKEENELPTSHVRPRLIVGNLR